MARTSPQQILKANAEIMIEFSQIVFHEDKKQVHSLNSNSNHNWINNADAPSLDRPYIPPKVFSRQCLHSVTIQFQRYQQRQSSSMFNR